MSKKHVEIFVDYFKTEVIYHCHTLHNTYAVGIKTRNRKYHTYCYTKDVERVFNKLQKAIDYAIKRLKKLADNDNTKAFFYGTDQSTKHLLSKVV